MSHDRKDNGGRGLKSKVHRFDVRAHKIVLRPELLEAALQLPSMEARKVVSLQTSLESRVPVAVGIYNGEVTVVCPGRGGGGGAFSELQQQDTSCTLHLYRLYNPKKEVRNYFGILWPSLYCRTSLPRAHAQGVK